MNFGQKESFFERHPYFFEDYYFNFEGLPSEKEKSLVDTVKKLKGEITSDADYTLCEMAYFKKQKANGSHTDYYSINFIDDCISQNKMLNIKEYRFHEEKENVGDNVEIISCNNNISMKAEKTKKSSQMESKRNFESKTKNSFLKTNKINNDPLKNWKKKKTIIHRVIEKEVALDQINEKVPEVIDISSDESDEVPAKSVSQKNLKILDPLSINSKFNSNKRINEGDEKKQKSLRQSSEEVGPSSNSKKSKNTVEDLTELSENENAVADEDSCSSPIGLQLSSPVSPSSASAPSSPSSLSSSLSSDDDDNGNGSSGSIIITNKKKWWRILPKPPSVKVHNDINRNIKRSRRGGKFTLSEQRTMIAFLIKQKLICGYSEASRGPWEQMHKKGYLLHRTVESLSNHYRRSILPNIQDYKLPKKYEKRFLLTRRR